MQSLKENPSWVHDTTNGNQVIDIEYFVHAGRSGDPAKGDLIPINMYFKGENFNFIR